MNLDYSKYFFLNVHTLTERKQDELLSSSRKYALTSVFTFNVFLILQPSNVILQSHAQHLSPTSLLGTNQKNSNSEQMVTDTDYIVLTG